MRQPSGSGVREQARSHNSEGFALLTVVIILALFCLMGLYVAVNAATEIHISDNYESEIQARFAAFAGLDHARAALRGLNLDDLLKGPDGINDNSAAYMANARTLGFRNPVPWSLIRSLDILDPAGAVISLPDDGLLNTGLFQSIPGTTVIPKTGIALTAPDPTGPGDSITARYFVKIADNNGESSEIAGDPADSPFIDGDGLIVVRSMGVAASIPGYSRANAHDNSVVVFEARFKRRSTFELDAPILVQGTRLDPSASAMFDGNSFSILGGAGNPAIGVIDADTNDAIDPAAQIAQQLSPAQVDNIRGEGTAPSIQDLTAAVGLDSEKSPLLNKDYVWDFIQNRAPRFADSFYQGSQDWLTGPAPDLGNYDSSLLPNAPGQRPRITVVDGNLLLGGIASGAGLLLVTGKLSVNAGTRFKGLILVVGKGDLEAGGLTCEVIGGIYVASLSNAGGMLRWEGARLSIGGSATVVFDRQMIRMAIALIPPAQVGFREVTSSLDP